MCCFDLHVMLCIFMGLTSHCSLLSRMIFPSSLLTPHSSLLPPHSSLLTPPSSLPQLSPSCTMEFAAGPPTTEGVTSDEGAGQVDRDQRRRSRYTHMHTHISLHLIPSSPPHTSILPSPLHIDASLPSAPRPSVWMTLC